MNVLRARFRVPTRPYFHCRLAGRRATSYSQTLRRYSAKKPTPQHGLWVSANGAPPAMRKEEAAKALVFATTNEKPHQWGNLLHYFWLRDNCRCSHCVNQDTGQRNFDTFKLPLDIEPTRLTTNEYGVEIQWSYDSHTSFYSWDFLEPYIKGNRPEPENVQINYFGEKGNPSSGIEYSEFEKDETSAVGRLTGMIIRNGFVFVIGVPTDSAKPTEDLLKKIAFIRETHYGGFYDFIPDLFRADTAYTNLALAAHTDGTYWSDPPGLQAFHLLSHTDSSPLQLPGADRGGKSLLVDGFHAAEILKKEDPGSFDVLARFGIPCHASGNKGITIAPDKLYTVLDYDYKSNVLHRIRWNNDDRGILPVEGEYSVMQWYRAAAKWRGILTRKELEYRFQLVPGTVLIFDNGRVLHGRDAFTGVRRICGGYINRDDFISRWRNTNFPRSQNLRQVIG